MNCMIDPVLLFMTVFISFAQQDAGIFSLHLVTALPVIAHLLHFSLLINDVFIYFFDVMSTLPTGGEVSLGILPSNASFCSKTQKKEQDFTLFCMQCLAWFIFLFD